MQQVYRRTPMLKCDSVKLLYNFTEIILPHGCSPVNLLHICGATVLTNTYGGILNFYSTCLSCCSYFFHTSNSIVYHTWSSPQIFEFNLNSFSQILHTAWRGDKNFKFQITPEIKTTRNYIRRSSTPLHFMIQGNNTIGKCFMKLHPETTTNAAKRHQTDY